MKLCELCSQGEMNIDINPLLFFFFRQRLWEGLGGVGGELVWVGGGGGLFEISAWTRKRINSIITKDYVHLGRGPPFSRQAPTVKSLFCESAPRGTLKKVIMFPHCGSAGPRRSRCCDGGRLYRISANKCALALPQFKVKPLSLPPPFFIPNRVFQQRI